MQCCFSFLLTLPLSARYTVLAFSSLFLVLVAVDLSAYDFPNALSLHLWSELGE